MRANDEFWPDLTETVSRLGVLLRSRRGSYEFWLSLTATVALLAGLLWSRRGSREPGLSARSQQADGGVMRPRPVRRWALLMATIAAAAGVLVPMLPPPDGITTAQELSNPATEVGTSCHGDGCTIIQVEGDWQPTSGDARLPDRSAPHAPPRGSP